MARPKAKAPARCYHISGQSVVTIAGRDFYLGPHDSPESIARYAVLIGIYQRNWLTLLLNTVTSAASACVLVAAGELIRVLLDVQEDTRRTAMDAAKMAT